MCQIFFVTTFFVTTVGFATKVVEEARIKEKLSQQKI